MSHLFIRMVKCESIYIINQNATAVDLNISDGGWNDGIDEKEKTNLNLIPGLCLKILFLCLYLFLNKVKSLQNWTRRFKK
jgi:hypothetical protein